MTDGVRKMNYKIRKMLMSFFIFFMSFHVSGCATLSPTVEKIQGEIVGFWEKVKGEQKEKQTATRQEAIRKYNYNGLKDELIIESPLITPNVVSPGTKIKHELQYTLLASQKGKNFKVSETVTLSGNEIQIELSKKESDKVQGTHVSTLQFVIPKDLNQGSYKIITVISMGAQKQVVTASFKLTQ
mgnify:CR=1 FL=1